MGALASTTSPVTTAANTFLASPSEMTMQYPLRSYLPQHFELNHPKSNVNHKNFGKDKERGANSARKRLSFVFYAK